VGFRLGARTGFNLVFYRTFAVPHITGLLGHTGQLEQQPLKRSMDTGVLMYELIDSGPDSPRGRTVIEMLNRMHRKWSIVNDDYRYVLATFIVVPTRWIDEFGWRRTTPEQRAATTEFYIEVGGHMGIRDLPQSYDEAATYLDAYESEHLGYSPAGAALTATLGVALAELFPRPLQGASGLLTRVMLNDDMCRALGLDPPSRLARRGFKALMGLRAKIVPFGRHENSRPSEPEHQAVTSTPTVTTSPTSV
jgi:hypothetical protein